LTLDSYLEENEKEDDERLKDVSLRIRKVNLCDGKHPSLLFFSWTRAEPQCRDSINFEECKGK